MHTIPIDTAVAAPGAVSRRPSPRWRSAVLGGFLGVSVLTHGLVLLLPVDESQAPRRGGPRAALQVRMQAPAPAPTTAAEPHTPRSEPEPAARAAAEHAAEARTPRPPAAAQASQPPPSRSAPQRADAPPAVAARPQAQPQPQKRSDPADIAEPDAGSQAATPATAASEAAAAPSEPADPSAAVQASLSDRVRARLEDSLRAHFYYPRIARHRGWEGRVEIGLRVEANGRLSAIRVLRTSGFAVLDRAALASIGRIAQLPEAAAWLGGRHIDMILPVQYRLVDG